MREIKYSVMNSEFMHIDIRSIICFHAYYLLSHLHKKLNTSYHIDTPLKVKLEFEISDVLRLNEQEMVGWIAESSSVIITALPTFQSS